MAPFLSLPPEIRSSVYLNLLPSPGSTISLSRDSRASLVHTHSHNYCALFMICRQIRQEASPLFYCPNAFVVSRDDLPRYIRALTPSTLSQLSQLRVSVPFPNAMMMLRPRRDQATASSSQTRASSGSRKPRKRVLPMFSRHLKALSSLSALKVLDLNLSVGVCTVQRFLDPSFLIPPDLETVIPPSVEIRIQIWKCVHCLKRLPQRSAANEGSNLETEEDQYWADLRATRWWTWSSAPSVPLTSPSEKTAAAAGGVNCAKTYDGQEESGYNPRTRRRWTVVIRENGIIVDNQLLPLHFSLSPTSANVESSSSSAESSRDDSYRHRASDFQRTPMALHSRCYFCKKSLLAGEDSLLAYEREFDSNSSHSLLAPSTHTPLISKDAVVCPSCNLVAFCDQKCAHNSWDHHFLCVGGEMPLRRWGGTPWR
jgi:hypothetical protein